MNFKKGPASIASDTAKWGKRSGPVVKWAKKAGPGAKWAKKEGVGKMKASDVWWK